MFKFFFALCIFSLSLGQFAAIYRLDGGNIYLFDVVILLFAFGGTLRFFKTGTFFIPKTILLYLLFCVVGLLSLVGPLFQLSIEQFIMSVFYLGRFVIYLLAAAVLYNKLRANEIGKEFVTKIIVFSALFIALVGFIQLVFLPDFENLEPALGWDPHKNRLASTFFDPNFVGAYLVLALNFVILQFQNKRKLAILWMVIMVLAIILTFSRSSWLILAITIFVYGVFKYKQLIVLALLVGFLAYFAIPRIQTRITGTTDPADSAHFRLISWQNSLTIAKDNLFLGIGFNTYRYAQKSYGFFEAGELGGNSGAGTDSSFLLVLATTGLIGFLLFVGAYFYPLLRSQAKSKQVTQPLTSIFLLNLTIALFIDTQFINAFFYPQILFLYLTGLVYSEA